MKLDKTKQESQLKDESLRKLEESLQNVETKVRGKDQTYKNQLEKIKELEGKLEMKIGLQSQSEKKVLNLSEKLKAKEESNEVLQQKVVHDYPVLSCSVLFCLFVLMSGFVYYKG